MQYNGGKARIARDLASVISEFKPRVYWEPFVGAAHVIQHVSAPARFGSDIDPHIISYLKLIQSGWIPPDLKVTDEIYREWRKLNPSSIEEFAIKAVIGYGCSFGGRWFEGLARDKRKNTSNSFYETAQIASRKQSPLIQNIQFFHGHFSNSIPDGTDLIYCDPPYRNTKYVGSKRKFEHDYFWGWCLGWALLGIRVLVTELSAPDFAKEIWSKTRAAHLLKNDGTYLTERLFMVQP